MDIRFYTDPETGLLHIYDHNVDEEEVKDVLYSAGEDSQGREGSRIAIGQTSAGRYLQVVYVPEPGGVFVITAYELKPKALAAYKRRYKKGGKA